jgi:hypothetical protein
VALYSLNLYLQDMDNNLIIIIVFVVLLVAADKITTYINIKLVEKNFPNIEKSSIEKNPLAKFFFQKFGLEVGSILYFFVSLFSFALAWFLFASTLTAFKVTNSISIALYIVTMFYFLVVGNNIFFMLKYGRIIN